MTVHILRPIGAMPLHPAEAMIVAAVTGAGRYIGQCTCRMLITGENDIDLYCEFKSHREAARAAH